MDTILPGLRAFAPDENSDQCDSDYNLIQCWRLQIATQQVMTLVICNMILTRRTFPSRRTAGAHLVKKVFQALAEHAAMLVAIRNLMRP